MKIKKNDLLSVMKQALPGVDKGKSLILGADTFIFSNNAIHSYNDHISVSVPFKLDKGISGAVKSLDFFKLITKMPTDEIDLTATQEVFKIVSGSANAEMTKVENTISDYISTLNIGDISWKPLPENFFEALRLCVIACNLAPQRGIFVLDDSMYSTDINRINRHSLKAKMDRFWLDDPAVAELMKIEKLGQYKIAEAWAHFKSEDGTVFSCKRKDDDSYPVQKMDELLKAYRKGDKDIENVLPKGLYNVADRVSTLASEMDGLPAVRMTIKQKDIEFFAERVAGRIREKLPFEKPFENEIDLKLWVDPFFLIEASRKVSSFYVKEVTHPAYEDKTTTILVFYNKDYMQVASTFINEEEK